MGVYYIDFSDFQRGRFVVCVEYFFVVEFVISTLHFYILTKIFLICFPSIN